MRHKESEAQKYQKEIKELKQELTLIEDKYSEEVKKLEEHYTKYRKNKSSKFN